MIAVILCFYFYLLNIIHNFDHYPSESGLSDNYIYMFVLHVLQLLSFQETKITNPNHRTNMDTYDKQPNITDLMETKIK